MTSPPNDHLLSTSNALLLRGRCDAVGHVGRTQERTEVGVSAKVEPHWLSVEDAKAYTSLGRDVIMAALMSGELVGYVKPVTYRKSDSYRQYRISTDDLDAWMRSQPPAKEGT